jgi:hypothetical protein
MGAMSKTTIAIGLVLFGIASAFGDSSAPQIDPGEYFPNAIVEKAQRVTLLRNVEAFDKFPSSSLSSPKALLNWLVTRDSLYRSLRKHDIYIYLRAEEDVNDRVDAAADAELSEAIGKTDIDKRTSILEKLYLDAVQAK